MTTENQKSEIVEDKNTEIATQSDHASLDMSSFAGVSLDNMVKHTPYIILVQGNNPVKEELGAVDGDIVAEGEIMKEGIEIMPVKSRKIYLEKEVKFDRKNNLDLLSAATLNTLEEQEFLALDTEEMDGVFLLKDAEGVIQKVFQPNLIYMVVSGGLPYQMSFKSYSKLKDAEKILNTAFRSSIKKKVGLNKVVLLLTSRKAKSSDGFEYFGYDCKFSRLASDEETKLYAQFSQKEVDIAERADLGE